MTLIQDHHTDRDKVDDYGQSPSFSIRNTISNSVFLSDTIIINHHEQTFRVSATKGAEFLDFNQKYAKNCPIQLIRALILCKVSLIYTDDEEQVTDEWSDKRNWEWKRWSEQRESSNYFELCNINFYNKMKCMWQLILLITDY